MIEFSDILYGKLILPDWIVPFVRLPEFVRLRGVRLSNVDSFQFKDLSGPTRWEHCIAVAALALRCGEKRRLPPKELIQLTLAALLHDVATPPFAHTMEYVLEGFDHEVESHRILRAIHAGDTDPSFPVFASQLPQFHKVCLKVSKEIGIPIDPDEVAKLIVGDGELGFLLNGTVDLDNADNVTRAALHLGLDVDKRIPLAVADWLATQKNVPVNLGEVRNEAVIEWVRYRNQLYSAFFDSSDEEQGRQAFLQHLCRRGVDANISRHRMIWNTDEGFLSLLETYTETSPGENALKLPELVQRYRLLEPLNLIAAIPVEDDETLRTLAAPAAVSWIEHQLCSSTFEPFVSVNSRRHAGKKSIDTLFPPASGVINIFKLGEVTKVNQLPDWLQQAAPRNISPHSVNQHLSKTITKRLSTWVREKPWLKPTPVRKQNIISNLQAVGDWSFRLSKNETLHTYPSTFVHAIPACLLSALGLRGELVIDPFGGTGQTATEVIKAGGRAVSGDVNSVATLVAKSKFTFLNNRKRKILKAITIEQIIACSPEPPPNFDLVHKWHHAATLKELTHIRAFITGQRDSTIAQFLDATFSSIITSTTGRKGKQHGFFADNTPLSKGESAPPYENALDLFVARVTRNIEVVEKFYSSIERAGRNPEEELKRVTAINVDIVGASPRNYGIGEHSAAGVITSPPYLCMSDYSLGQG